jgi:hypothetical protein
MFNLPSFKKLSDWEKAEQIWAIATTSKKPKAESFERAAKLYAQYKNPTVDNYLKTLMTPERYYADFWDLVGGYPKGDEAE